MAMSPFHYGVIEGFYGRQWSWAMRNDYARFLSGHQFGCYIYAPKGDAFLRSRWRDPLPQHTFDQLQQLANSYREHGVQWGMGLSPLGLSENYTNADRQALLAKVEQLNELEPDILCILFDDSRGDFADLAQRQCNIVADISAQSRAARFMVCPTYYSFDPVLQELFGSMPDHYLEDLGAGLDPAVEVFWTGNRVISAGYSEADIQRIAGLIQRKPLLWDNYPVNDGRVTSNFLNLQPYSQRPPQLKDWCSGHIVNPMNQPLLSRLVLQSLQGLYCASSDYQLAGQFKQGLMLLDHPALQEQLASDAPGFQSKGLEARTPAENQALARLYRDFDHPAADEVADWLEGKYTFDPECLTG